MSSKGASIYRTKRWQELRRLVLAEEPVCHWCHRAPSTEADHLIEIARDDGHDPYDRAYIVGSCKPCNSRRGSTYQAKAKALRRNGFLGASRGTPPPLLPLSRDMSDDRAASETISADGYVPGQITPRLRTPSWGDKSYAPLVAAWAEDNLGFALWPWQVDALAGALEHDDAGNLRHRWGLISTARQNGKTALEAALIGWWLTHGEQVRGGPQSVLSVAHLFLTGELVARQLFPVLEERYGFKTFNSSGRMEARSDTGSVWRIQSSTPRSGHGTSNDLLVVDELFAIPEVVLDAGLLPTQRARPNPLAMFLSTAGTEDSKAFIRWRERGMQIIERGEPDRLFMCEFSPPGNADPTDRRYWHMANPALGMGFLTMQDIEDAFNSPNRDAFMRSDLNMWTAAAGAWLPPGTWEALTVDDDLPAGGTLSVDSDVTDLRYVGVRAVSLGENRIQVKTEFVVESQGAMWDAVRAVMEDKTVKLNLTPGLADICPPELAYRMTMVGTSELGRQTQLVRNMILEGLVTHSGQLSLTEQVNRAVAGRTTGGITLSSQKSPGPIEQTRCLVWSVGAEARPLGNVRKPMIGTSSR